jgi:hypothetical protein
LQRLAASMKGRETVLEVGLGLELIAAVRDELKALGPAGGSPSTTARSGVCSAPI